MRIIAMADTHIKTGHVAHNLPEGLVALLREADLIIHAGDFVSHQAYDELSKLGKLEAVHGNMDEIKLKEMLPVKKVIEVEGIRIGIVHEAALHLQDTTGVRYMAKEMGVNVLVFGHLHRPVIEKKDVLMVCPGSPRKSRLSEPSVVELVIEKGVINVGIIILEGTRCSALESATYFHNQSFY
jgi:putative phosphoesterase